MKGERKKRTGRVEETKEKQSNEKKTREREVREGKKQKHPQE